MRGYLLDTSICVFLLRGKFNIADRLREIGKEQCFISSVTVAELLYGAYKSDFPESNIQEVKEFCSAINIVPFEDSIEMFAQEKNILRKEGTIIEDFDLLIACAAKAYNLILVTDNIKHLGRVNGISIENWVSRK